MQEVIVQNFRAKPTPPCGPPPTSTDEYLAAIAVTRLVLGPGCGPGAAEPRGPGRARRCCRAGVDDWGGVTPLTPDHVNPERPWPHVDDLARLTAEAGFALRERLTAHPQLRPGRGAVDRPARPAARAGARRRRRAGRRGPAPGGRPWQEPDPQWAPRPGRVDLHARSTPRAAPATAAATSTRSTATGRRCARTAPAPAGRPPGRPVTAGSDAAVGAALRGAEADPAGLTDAECAGPDRRRGPRPRGPRVARRPRPRGRRRRRRDLRRQPEHQLHQRLLHRLPVLRLRAAPHRRRRLHAVARPGRRPRRRGVALGATEVCMQGGIDPELPGTAYFDLARAVKAAPPGHARARLQPDGGRQRRGPHRAVVPGLPDGGARGRASTPSPGPPPRSSTTRSAGCSPRASCRRRPGSRSSRPRTRSGCRSSATMMYGHVDHPTHWVAHLRALAAHPGRDRRLHRVRAAAVRAPERAGVPRRAWPAPARPSGRTARSTRSRG